jgi:hypothetical protein
MKIEAKARLQATTATISGPITVTFNSGEDKDFPSYRWYQKWADDSGHESPTKAIRIGHYDVLLMGNHKDTAVAKIYKDLNIEPGDKHSSRNPENPGFRQFVSWRKQLIKDALGFLQRSHHPMMGNVKKDADEELHYFDSVAKDAPIEVDFTELRKHLKSSSVHAHRTQDWFHRLDHETKAEYKKKFPGTKFVNKQKLIAP